MLASQLAEESDLITQSVILTCARYLPSASGTPMPPGTTDDTARGIRDVGKRRLTLYLSYNSRHEITVI